MSTKISKGARLHLLRAMQKLNHPMIVVRMLPCAADQRNLRALLRDLSGRQAFVLPPGFEMSMFDRAVSA